MSESMEDNSSSSSAPPEEILSDLEAMEEKSALPPAPATEPATARGEGEEEKQEIADHEEEWKGDLGMVAENQQEKFDMDNTKNEPNKSVAEEQNQVTIESTAAETEGVQEKTTEISKEKSSSNEEQVIEEGAENPDQAENEEKETGVDAKPTTTKEESTPPLVHVGSRKQSAPAPENSSEFPRQRWLVISCSIFLFLVIVSQAVVIGLLAIDDKDDQSNDRDIQGDDLTSPFPITIPTATPTATPTTNSIFQPAPTATPTTNSIFQPAFRSIATAPGAIRLDAVSGCDECAQSFRVPTNYILPWNLDYPVSMVTVESNGVVTLECDFYGTCGYVDVVGMDLDPFVTGDVYILWVREQGSTSDQRQPVGDFPNLSLIVSWEEVMVYGYLESQPFKVNSQVTISDGGVEICFGEGDVGGNIFRTGVMNVTGNGYDAATGDAFSPEGYARQFPDNTCQDFAAEQSTMNPTQSYTSRWPTSSTMGPTNPSFDGFTNLSLVPEAKPLETVSSCNDCTETIKLPFDFRWNGKYPIYEVIVSSNGSIDLVGECGLAAACAQINVIAMDLDPSRDNGINVRYYERGTLGLLIISWEEVPIYNVADGRVSGQVILHPDGRIDVCWGSIFILSENVFFRSNIIDVDGNVHLATGPYFDSGGQSRPFIYPEYMCQTLLGAPDVLPLPSRLYSKEFYFLSANPESTRLEKASDFDDEGDVFGIEYPIQWFEGTSTNRLLVTSNGGIRIDGCPTECSECGTISVAAADLDPSQSGDIWILDSSSLLSSPDSETAYIVSWEDVAFSVSPESRINAQVHFYYNGTIEMCWGPSVTGGNSIRAGLFDPRFNAEVLAWGGPFDAEGFTKGGDWPTELCQAFYLDSSPTQSEPTLYPTFVPTKNPVNAPLCVPTSGFCATTEFDLKEMVTNARIGDTISICGEFGVSETISIDKRSVTVCCDEDSILCSLDRLDATAEPLMTVTGGNFTLIRIRFQNGYSALSGGNLVIDAPGYHTIAACTFSGGRAGNLFGGNLYARGANGISIVNSIFESGEAARGGSGAAFEDTLSVSIRTSIFRNNQGEGFGGGLLFFHTPAFSEQEGRVQVIFIIDSSIEGNSAATGGGMLVREVNAVRMTVLDSFFNYNRASLLGGAAAVVRTETITANFNGNYGGENLDSSGTCLDFYFQKNGPGGTGGFCFTVDDEVSLPFLETETVPTATPTVVDTTWPNYHPTGPPVGLPACIGTSEFCAATESELKEMVSLASANDVISLCGGLMYISETITVSQLNITICCEAYPRCTLSGTNYHSPVMSVSDGGHFTVVGLRFQAGSNAGNGGNLVIEGPGYHSILYCEFFSGVSDNYGGSLYVGNANSVSISNSNFDSGFATGGGGAAAFLNTDVVSIEACKVKENNGGLEGGGLLFLGDELHARMEISIVDTIVEGNIAISGGGLVVKGVRSLEMIVLDSSFERNVVKLYGAAGAIYVAGDIFALFEGNQGESNIDGSMFCDGFYIDNNSSGIGQVCHNVSEELMLPWTSPPPTEVVTEFPSSVTFTPQPTITSAPSLLHDLCQPTIGDCISNYDVLAEVLNEAESADVIALCGGEIKTPRALYLWQANITLCCSDPGVGCQLTSGGIDRIATLVGPNVTLQSIQFLGGNFISNGGNVAIIAPGYHSIIDCSFVLGVSGGHGGGLSVKNAHRIDIHRTIFLGNVALNGGGGLATLDTREIMTKQTLFESNRGGGIGGGVFFSMAELNVPHSILFESTTFRKNVAESGGGFLGSSLGNMPRLEIRNSVFNGNIGVTGGAGIVLNHFEHKELFLRFFNNTGEENISSDTTCNGFTLLMDFEPDIPSCLELSDDFSHELIG